jgi:hypothetical protein
MNMKSILATALVVALGTTPALADCSLWSVGGALGVANIRSNPTMNSEVLWTLNSVGNGSDAGSLIWCGRYVMNGDTMWRWVAFKLKDEPWVHKGWVSSKVMILYNGATKRSFEEGGE